MGFEVIEEDARTRARLGRLTTSHGVVETPVFMDVGTLGTVKALAPCVLEHRLVLASRARLGDAGAGSVLADILGNVPAAPTKEQIADEK